MRKEKLKKDKEEFERLKSEDPEKALEKLKEIEFARTEERMKLRHRDSKWLHLQKSRSGRDEMVFLENE